MASLPSDEASANISDKSLTLAAVLSSLAPVGAAAVQTPQEKHKHVITGSTSVSKVHFTSLKLSKIDITSTLHPFVKIPASLESLRNYLATFH